MAFFFTCLTLAEKTEKTLSKAQGYADSLELLIPGLFPVGIGQFAGVLDYSKMSLLKNVFSRGAYTILGVHEGDYRDWNAIETWASHIQPDITTTTTMEHFNKELLKEGKYK